MKSKAAGGSSSATRRVRPLCEADLLEIDDHLAKSRHKRNAFSTHFVRFVSNESAWLKVPPAAAAASQPPAAADRSIQERVLSVSEVTRSVEARVQVRGLQESSSSGFRDFLLGLLD